MKVKRNPMPLFWEKANCWRKLKLLRSLGSIKTSIAKKYVDEMNQLRKDDGGFSRIPDEASSITPTSEAIINLTKLNQDVNIAQRAMNFLWRMQKGNGSWHENPSLAKDKVPFWSSTEKGVPILTADCIEAFVEVGCQNDKRVVKAVDWLKQMQSHTGMWLSLEGTDLNDTEPDSTQRAISALLKFGLQKDSPTIRKACNALENFILKDANEWAKTHPPVWPWIAPLDGLAAAGYAIENKAVQFALKNILNQQQEDGSWPNGYEIRIVPTLISLGIIPSKEALEAIQKTEQKT
jgi:squalene cyclase